MNSASDREAWDMVESLTTSGLVVPPLGTVDRNTIRKQHHFRWYSREIDLGVLHGFDLEAVAHDIAERGAAFAFLPVSNALTILATSPVGDVVLYWQHGFGSTYGGVTEQDIADVNAVSKTSARQWAARPDTGATSDAVRWLAYQRWGATGFVDLDALRDGALFDDAHRETGRAETAEDAIGLLEEVLQRCTDGPERRLDAASPKSEPGDDVPAVAQLVPYLAEALRRLEDDSHLVIGVHDSNRYVQFATFRPNLRLETIGTRYLEDAGETWSVDEVVWLAEHAWHDADDDGNLWRDWIPADEDEAAAAAVDVLVNVHGVTSVEQVWFQSEDDNALAALEGLAPPEPIEPTRPIPPDGLQPTSPERAAEINAVLNAYVEGKESLPSGTRYLAVIDYVDRDAVLEVLGVIDGEVYRRHDRRWHFDAGWRKAFPKAPARSILALSPDQLSRVLPMVDSSTADQPFKRLELSALEMYWPSYRPNDPELFDWSQLDAPGDLDEP